MAIQVSWLEFDTTASPLDVNVSWLEFDTTSSPQDVKVSWVEFDTTASPQDIRVSWVEFDTQAEGAGDHIPLVGGVHYRRGKVKKEEEVEIKPKDGIVWEHTVFASDIEQAIEPYVDKVTLEAIKQKKRQWKIRLLLLDS